MNKKSLLTILATFSLVSCSNKMPKITEDRAKELAKEILAHQSAKTFVEPKNFTMTTLNHTVEESLSIEQGKNKTIFNIKMMQMIDVDNLVMRSYDKQEIPNESSNETDQILYFDSSNNMMRTLYNTNGYKTRTEFSCLPEQAKIEFLSIRDKAERIYKWDSSFNEEDDDGRPFLLVNFSRDIDYYHNLHEQYKDDSSQHCNLYTGSSGSKSLQVNADAKIKYQETIPHTECTYSGYIDADFTITFRNDLLSSMEQTSSSDLTWDDDKRFYTKNTEKSSIKIEYGNTKIKIPNYKDYKLIKSEE